MAKKQQNTEKHTHFTVSFNCADKLINVFTGEEEAYHFETRDNVDIKHYIVKLVEREYGSIEYDIYHKSYCRFDPEPEITLFDYLYYKYGYLNDELNDRVYGDAVWHCPDTGETFAYADIRKAFIDNIRALNGELTN